MAFWLVVGAYLEQKRVPQVAASFGANRHIAVGASWPTSKRVKFVAKDLWPHRPRKVKVWWDFKPARASIDHPYHRISLSSVDLEKQVR